MSLLRRFFIPVDCLGIALRHSFTHHVHVAQPVLGPGVAQFSGTGIPARSPRNIRFHACAAVIKRAYFVLGQGVVLPGKRIKQVISNIVLLVP